jgi:M6 family metalloprotease-like protein
MADKPRIALADYLEEAAAGAFSFASVQVVALDPGTGELHVNGGTDRTHTRMPRTATEYVGGDGGFWKKKKRDLDSNDMVRDLADLFGGVDMSRWTDSEGHIHHVLVVTPSADPRGSATADTATSFIPTALFLSSWTNGFRYFGLAGELQEGRPAGAFPGAGTAIHEYLHNLGLPDLYDTTHQTGGIGQVGIMGTGMFTGQQSAPLGLIGLMREQLSWLTPRYFVADSAEVTRTFTLTLPPLSASGGVNRAVKIQVGTGGDDFLYLENRQATGLDAGIAAGGLCPGVYVYHVNKYDWSDRLYATLTNTASYRQVKLVQRDGTYFGDVREEASCDRVAFGAGDTLSLLGIALTIDHFDAPYTGRQVCVLQDTVRFATSAGHGATLGAVAAGQRLAVDWSAYRSSQITYPLTDGSFLPKAFASPCVADATVSLTFAGREAGQADRDDWLDDVATAGARVSAGGGAADGSSGTLDGWVIGLIVGGVLACCCLAVLCVGCVVATIRWRNRKAASRRRLRTASSFSRFTNDRTGGSSSTAARVSRTSRQSTSHLHSASLHTGGRHGR